MSRHRRRSARSVIGIVVGVTVLAGSIAAVAMRESGEGADRPPAQLSCPATLQVVTASSFAPVLDRLAPALDAAPDCVRLDISVVDGRAASRHVADIDADVWIPDDAAWAGIADAVDLAEPSIVGSGTTLATSPLYMVADPATADRVRQAGGGWRGLVELVTTNTGVRVVVREPASSGDGLVAVGALGEAVWVDDGMDASAEALATALPATRAVYAGHALPEQAGEVGLVAEYAIVRLMPVAGGELGRILQESVLLPGSDHSAVLRYTWLPTASAVADPVRADGLLRVFDMLTGPGADDALATVGLRRPDLSLPAAAPMDLPDLSAAPFDVFGPHQVDHVFATWYEEDRRSDLLVVVDVSGSMAAVPPGSETALIDLVQDGIMTLADLLPDDSQIALWEFGVLLDPPRDYLQLVPRDQLDSAQRQQLAEAVDDLRAGDTGTGLYDTILAAYLAAKDGNREGVPNHVILFTDGRNEDDPNSISVGELRAQLAAEADPDRPVNITIITFGPEPETDVLADALAPVAGYVDPLQSPDDVLAVFIHAAAGGVHH